MSLPVPEEPFEWLELKHGQKVTFRPTRFKLDRQRIQRRDRPAGALKDVQVLTVYYEKGPAEPGVDFWDIDAGSLIYQLWPILPRAIEAKRAIEVTASGDGPKKRFSVRVV